MEALIEKYKLGQLDLENKITARLIGEEIVIDLILGVPPYRKTGDYKGVDYDLLKRETFRGIVKALFSLNLGKIDEVMVLSIETSSGKNEGYDHNNLTYKHIVDAVATGLKIDDNPKRMDLYFRKKETFGTILKVSSRYEFAKRLLNEK